MEWHSAVVCAGPSPFHRSDHVPLARALVAAGRPEAVRHPEEQHSWGRSCELDRGPGYRVTRLVVDPGAELALGPDRTVTVLSGAGRLAGDWSKPKIEGVPVMDPDRYKRSLYAALDMIGLAIGASADIRRQRAREENFRRADRFVACTADAAEHLAKAIMGRHAIDAWHTHDLNELADQARQAGLGTLAADGARMNGATRRDHLAGYHGADQDSLAHAIDRLPVVLELTRRELAALPADFLGPQETADLKDAAVGSFREKAVQLRSAVERDGADMPLPAPVDWITPLLRTRETLEATLDDAASALERDD